MAGPWEKYAAPQGAAQATPQQGPWTRYSMGEAASPEPRVIATTRDGGRVLEAPDGTRSFTSPGFATSDPARIEQIMEGAKPVDLVQGDLDRERIAANPIAARVQEFNQGVPLVGEWLDEAVGVVAPQAAQNMRATSDAMERQNPVESAALNLAGGVAAVAPLAVAGAGQGAANFIGRAGSNLGRVGRTMLAGGAAGAIEGGASFAGRDDENRLSGLGTGAAVGGALGAVLAPFADALGTGVASLAKRFKKLDVTEISEQFGIDAAAARTVREALLNDDLDAAAARLGQLGDDAMLADAGPATGALLDAASKTGGEALATTRSAVEDRAQQFGARLTGRLDNILGAQSQGLRASARDIAQSTSAARTAAYNAAYRAPIDYADDVGRNIEGVLRRIPSRTLNSAVQEANEAMQEAGLRNMQIMAQIADDGSVTFREMPNVQQLDYIKRALGDISQRETDDFGRLTAAGLRSQRLARDLRDAVGEAVPQYRTALKLGGDKLQQDQALDLGRRLLSPATKVEDVSDFIRSNRGMSREAREAAAQGLRENIETALGNVRRTITDPNTDAREAMQLVKDMSSRNNIAKVRMILGQEKADALISELDKQAAALALRGVVARGSDTAIRQSIQRQVTDETTPGVVRRTLGNLGSPLDAGREITQTIAGIDPRSMNAAERAQFAQIARALTDIRGQEAQRALVAVRRALAGQPLKDGEAQLIGRAVAAGSFEGSRQGLTRPLESTPQ